MNAVTLQMLLTAYYTVLNTNRLNAAQKEGLAFLKVNNLLSEENMIAPRGICHVKALLSVQLPIQSWVSPNV